MSKNKEKIMRYDSAYKAAFTTVHGKRVLQHLIEHYHVMTTVFDKDPVTMAFLEGQRSVVLDILKIIKQDTQRIERAFEDREKEFSEGLNI